MEYLKLGTITGSFGLDGTLRLLSSTDFPEERYQEGNHVFLYNPNTNSRQQMTVVSFRATGKFDFLKLEEINVKEDADALKGYEIHAEKDASKLPDGYFYFSDLIGLNIIDEKGNYLGKVTKVEEFPAQITLRAKTDDGKEFFVPYVKAFIIDTNLEKKEIKINLIEGML